MDNSHKNWIFSPFYLWNTKDDVKKNVRDILHWSEWWLSLSFCLTSPIGFHWLKKECHTGLDSWNNTNFIFGWHFPLKGQFTQYWNHHCHHLLTLKKDILRNVSVVFGPYKVNSHQNNLVNKFLQRILCFAEVSQIGMRVSKWQDFHFWVNYTFKNSI